MPCKTHDRQDIEKLGSDQHRLEVGEICHHVSVITPDARSSKCGSRDTDENGGTCKESCECPPGSRKKQDRKNPYQQSWLVETQRKAEAANVITACLLLRER